MRSEHIIAASVVLILCFVSIMALVTRFLVQKHAKHTSTSTTADVDIERQHQLTNISSSWNRLLSHKQIQNKQYWAPTLSGILKAGDEGLFSSTLFANLHGQSGEIPLEALYKSFANELRACLTTDRSTFSGDIAKFLVGTKRTAGGHIHRKSGPHNAANVRTDAARRLQRKSMEHLTTEKVPARTLSMRKSLSSLVPVGGRVGNESKYKVTRGSWMQDGHTMDYQDGRMCLKATPEELAALSILLASPLDADASTDDTAKGAFRLSISSISNEGGERRVVLREHKHSLSQQHARGSGFSPLFARHLAAGSMPYSQDGGAVHSALITNETFEAVQIGATLSADTSHMRTPQSRFLSSLPSSIDTHFHSLVVSTEEPSDVLVEAISALPFSGGLTPLASAPLIKTIQFMASGGQAPGRLLQRLEGLVDKVHSLSPQLNNFGPLYEPHHAGLLYREHERLGRLAKKASADDTLAHKTARMSRYTTLLERLMALVTNAKPQDVLSAVREATKAELQRTYADAVATHADPTSKRQSFTSRISTNPSTRSSSSSANSFGSPSSTSTFPPQNLGRQVESVLKSDLPLDVGTIAFVARMVIVAWTLSVETVAWEEGEIGFKVPDVQALGEKIVMF